MGKRPPSSDIETGSCVKHPPLPPFTPTPPEQWCSWLLPLIFEVNITMFIYAMYVNDCPANTGSDNCILYDYLGRFSFQPLKENAILGPSLVTLERFGALDPIAIVKDGEEWRFFSCIWLHAGVAYLATNMISLLLIEIPLEQEFGFFSTLLLIITLNLAFGLIPHVDNPAHIGGFLSGFLLGFILLIRPQYGYVSRRYIPAGYDIKRKPKHKCYQYIMSITALIVLIIGYLWGLALRYSGRRLNFPSKSFS
ncbi:hypothetical protein P3X46_010879 [Hevea brasiliensis]|uniref:RHOMBOID-like protein n=1 Tax=Hevea brasiliensis TaxID=3981 RepID=A0ABQ9MHH0_HEVBR|nr:hypothetical protein P3X46_010879 [Hevea brasiliensis]